MSDNEQSQDKTARSGLVFTYSKLTPERSAAIEARWRQHRINAGEGGDVERTNSADGASGQRTNVSDDDGGGDTGPNVQQRQTGN